MPTLSAKRQVALPAKACKELNIGPGDEVEIFRHGQQINIVKKQVGAAAGLLKGINANQAISDAESLQGNFE